MLIMRHHPRGRGFRLFAIIVAALFVLGLLLVLTPRAAASQQAQAASPAASSAPTPAASSAWMASLDSLVTAELARTRTPGAQVAVVVDGKIAYSKGFGIADIETRRPVTDQTLFRVGSVTKMVTAAAAAQMAAEKTLDLNAPISRYVTEIAGKGPRVAGVTTHQLLSHSAGWLDNAVPYGRMGEGALGEVFTEITDTISFTEPGRVISYSNPGYSMVGYVIERAGHGRFASVVDRLVLKKMGMPHATFRPLSALTYDFSQGHIPSSAAPSIVRPFTENTAQWAAGFLFASAGELARFTIAMMDGGMLDGQRVLAPEAITMMTTGHMAMPGGTARYGYGLSVNTQSGQRVWRHGGSINGFDAQVTMFPDRKLAVLVFDNLSGSPLVGITDHVARLVAGISPDPVPTLAEPREATAVERGQLVGTYRNGSATAALYEENGALMFKRDLTIATVKLIGDDRMVATPKVGSPTTMLLVRDPASGRVEYVHMGLRSLGR